MQYNKIINSHITIFVARKYLYSCTQKVGFDNKKISNSFGTDGLASLARIRSSFDLAKSIY